MSNLKSVPSTPALGEAHQPFSWLGQDLKGDASAEFAALTMDVCRGVDLCLEILHADHMVRIVNRDADPGEEKAPAFGLADGERLLRLAMVSARLLSDAAEVQIERASARSRGTERGTK